MEAKTWEETVKMPDDLTPSQQQLYEQIKPYLEAQAKLTWDIAEKAGIKKVVDWMPELIQQIKNCMWSDEWGVKGVIYENILDPLVERQLQAFLKKCEK